MIYLASPLTHDDPRIRAARIEGALAATDFFLRAGVNIFSPIVYTAQFKGMPIEYEHWRFMNDEMIRLSEAVWVLMLPGWEKSRGILHELAVAERMGVPIWNVDTRFTISPGRPQ